MAALTNYLEYQLGDHLFRGQSYTAPTSLFIGLVGYYNSGELESGVINDEISGNNYGRTEYGSTTGNWTNTSGSLANINDISFNQAIGGGWGDVSGLFISTSGTGGDILFHAPLSSSVTVGNGDTFKFAASALTINLY